ncbi:MAG: hypothetical protein Q9M43_06600 [Sulfurimonas sp.]|nr:hypothetical protein [Sulfurimonas sp.]
MDERSDIKDNLERLQDNPRVKEQSLQRWNYADTMVHRLLAFSM